MSVLASLLVFVLALACCKRAARSAGRARPFPFFQPVAYEDPALDLARHDMQAGARRG
jgi:hypothetical protein